MKQVDYDKKIKHCEKLGAKKMQNFVFKIEKVKWKVVKTIIPNYIKLGDRLLERKRDKIIKKTKDKDLIDNIRRETAKQKMILRREYNRDENFNYHITKRPTEFLEQLEMNKNIHKRGLRTDAVTIAAGSAITALSYTSMLPDIAAKVAIPIVACSGVCAFVNFQCINIQNYNIYRVKKIKKKLKEKEQKQASEQIEKYGKAYELIGNLIEEKKDIIDYASIVNNINDKEQLAQLQQLINNEIKERKIESHKGNEGVKKNGRN